MDVPEKKIKQWRKKLHEVIQECQVCFIKNKGMQKYDVFANQELIEEVYNDLADLKKSGASKPKPKRKPKPSKEFKRNQIKTKIRVDEPKPKEEEEA